MKDVLDVVLHSFWSFIGTVILMIVASGGLARIIYAIRGIPYKE